MNERIRQLAEQCESFGSWDNKTYTFDKQKFAELIVAECADVCENLQKWPSTEPRHCANDIRIHFGVEE